MNLEEQYRILEFGEFGDERGSLVVAEGGGKDIPFEIKEFSTCMVLMPV